MQAPHELDVLLILAITLAAKRRPAALDEILAAFAFMQRPIPAPGKLLEGFRRLAKYGLIQEDADRYSLTPSAAQLIARLPVRADTEQRLFGIHDALRSHPVEEQDVLLNLNTEQITAAIEHLRHLASEGGTNMLMPKPKPDELASKRPKRRPGPPSWRRR